MDIAEYRAREGLTQAEFARLLTEAGSKTSQGLVWQWESGKTRVTPNRATYIERVTNGAVSRDELIWGRGEQQRRGSAAAGSGVEVTHGAEAQGDAGVCGVHALDCAPAKVCSA